MIRKLPRLQEATPGVAGTGAPAAAPATPAAPAAEPSTLLSSAAPTPTPAPATAPAAGAAPAAPAAGATQQPPADPATAPLTPEAQAAADAAAAEAAKAAERVVPEKYEFKAPDGVTLEPVAVGELEGIAKELKLTQEEAQKLSDVGVKMAQRQAAAVETQVNSWIETSRADAEFGGDKLQTSLATGEKALKAFGTPELGALLRDSRLANHPEVIRFMVRAGKAISEDRMVTGGAGPSTSPSASVANSLYPHQK